MRWRRTAAVTWFVAGGEKVEEGAPEYCQGERAGGAGVAFFGWLERAGCVFCVHGAEPGVAELRTLLVTPAARGLGVGAELVGRVLSFARGAGHTRVTLWTTATQSSARRIYEATGFTLTSEDAHHSLGHDLLGQDWMLDLAPITAASGR